MLLDKTSFGGAPSLERDSSQNSFATETIWPRFPLQT
jgi:hypothetical protein